MTQRRTVLLRLCAVLLAAGLGACAVAPARMELPPQLLGADSVPFEGLGFGRSGSFFVAGRAVRFERSADRLSLFGTVGSNRAALEFSVAAGTPAEVHARCTGRGADLQRGSATLQVQPMVLTCEMRGRSSGRLQLGDAPAPRPGLLQPASWAGRYTSGPLTIDIAAVHALQGTPMPLDTPAGHVFTHAGRPVAALELTGRRPLLRRLPATSGAAAAAEAAEADAAVADAILHASIALALLWDPQHAPGR